MPRRVCVHVEKVCDFSVFVSEAILYEQNQNPSKSTFFLFFQIPNCAAHNSTMRLLLLVKLLFWLFSLSPSLSLSTMRPPIVDIVTGSTQGIGKAIAEFIAQERSKNIPEKYLLVLVGRNSHRGTKTQNALHEVYPNVSVQFQSVDLGKWQDVQALEQTIASHLGQQDYHVGILVNDAAECPQRQEWAELKQRHDDGEQSAVKVDKQFASNVLGYHFMIKAFQKHYSLDENTGHPTHIVNVASTWAGSLDLEDINFKRRSYDNDDAYRQAKQCDRMLSRSWSQRLHNQALVNACHPGDPCTTLSKALGYNLFASSPTVKFIHRDTPIPYLCGLTGSEVKTTGGWFVGTGGEPSRCGFATKTGEAEQLFDLCESFCQ